MSSWGEERRRNLAAEGAERRKDEDAREERRRKSREAEDQRRRDSRRKAREDKRAENGRKRREKLQRRAARAARRQKLLTPGNVYRRGTLLLIAFSAAASLPAQIMHFVGISWALLPIGPAVEGAAWVMAAGVAYADERKLPAWVRWLLRGLSLAAAAFAANINYQYGTGLEAHGLTHAQAQTAGLGLAAVTIGGPLFFEVRQWVLTLSASTLSPKQQAVEKAKAKHAKKRAKAFPDVAERARQLILSAPFGSITEDAAFATAWLDVKGAPRGSSASVIADRLEAEQEVAAVLEERGRAAVDSLLAELFPSDGGGSGVAGGLALAPGDEPQDGAPGGRESLGGKGKQPGSSKPDSDPHRPLDEADLEKVRKLADALGGAHRLSAKNVRETVGCRNDYALRLRDAVRAERAEGETK